MYHSINDADTDPWNICVSEKYFEQQISFLKENYRVIDIEELIYEIKHNSVAEKTVCITFDDGYADNFINAVPILEKHNCSATFFISSAFIGHKIFWWHELESIFLHAEKLPSRLLIKVKDRQHEFYIEEEILTTKQLEMHGKWRWYKKAPTTRCMVFAQLYNLLQPLNNKEIQTAINEIKCWAKIENAKCTYSVTMLKKQLQKLSQHPLFSIGLHTHTHAALKNKHEAFQYEEIKKNKQHLFKELNIRANMLAYPYGLYDENSIHVAESLQLDACFTTNAGTVYNSSNLHALNRVQVRNESLRSFQQRLLNVFNKMPNT